MDTGSFPVVKYGRGVLLTAHPLLVPWSWKSRAIPLSTLWATPRLVMGTLHLYFIHPNVFSCRLIYICIVKSSKRYFLLCFKNNTSYPIFMKLMNWWYVTAAPCLQLTNDVTAALHGCTTSACGRQSKQWTGSRTLLIFLELTMNFSGEVTAELVPCYFRLWKNVRTVDNLWLSADSLELQWTSVVK